ncbi:hypothetical protein BD770DRAFT_304518, partial [Pilaira anomala]
IPFNKVVIPIFKARFLTKAQEILPFLREMIIKTHMLINYYILASYNKSIPGKIFNQKFWHSICLLLGDKVTVQYYVQRHRSFLNLANTYNTFITWHPTSIIPIVNLSGYSICLSTACVTISTIYTNYYVKTYERKLRKYLIYKLSIQFSEVASSYIIKRI